MHGDDELLQNNGYLPLFCSTQVSSCASSTKIAKCMHASSAAWGLMGRHASHLWCVLQLHATCYMG